MNEHPEVRWQPPSENDLKRFPPANATCGAFRAMLRDYADGDLPKGPRRNVEQHVHECRDCALALSRVEHETLRLRRALSGMEVTAPPGLKSRVLERILADDVAAPQPVETQREVRRGVPLPVAVFLSLAAMLVGALVVLEPWRGGSSGPVLRAVSADGAWVEEEYEAHRIGPLEILPQSCVIRVDSGGHAVFVVENGDPGGGQGPGATDPAEVSLEVHQDSRLRLASGKPVLVQGTVTVRSGRLQEIGLEDGTRLGLGRGSYHIDVTSFRRFDAAVGSERETLRLRLEVAEGDSARLARLGGPVIEVGPQKVARYEGWSPLILEPSLDEDEVTSRLRPSAASAVGLVPDAKGLAGSVVDARTGLPVPGAQVRVRLPGGGTEHRVDTDDSGRFLLPLESAQELDADDHVLVAVDPPARDPDLALLPMQPAGLIDRGGRLAISTVALRSVTPMHGTVRDPNYRWLQGARVLPCLVDELTGRLMPLEVLQTEVGPDGGFVLRGLPVDLRPYQALVLVVAHETAGVVVEPLPDTELAVANDLRLDVVLGGKRVELELPPGKGVRIVELLGAREGVTVAREHVVDTDFAGRATVFSTGGELLWVRGGDGSLGVPLAPEGGTAGSPLTPVTDGERQVVPTQRIEVLGPLDVFASLGHRYTGLPGPGGPDEALAVVEQDSNRRVPGAELFALKGDELRLLGFAGAGRVASAADSVLLGIGPQGALGVLSIAGGGEPSLELVRGGRLELAPSLRPGPEAGPMPLRLVCRLHGGPLAEWIVGRTFVRFAAGAGTRPWTTEPLPAGSWLVMLADGTVREVELAPGTVTLLE